LIALIIDAHPGCRIRAVIDEIKFLLRIHPALNGAVSGRHMPEHVSSG
jgi:hypothetical protein